LSGLLVLQLKRIGDAVLTAPVLGALRTACPDRPITLVLAGAAGGLGPLFSMVDEVLVWQPGKLNLGLLHRVRELRPEVVLDYTGTDRSALLGLISAAPVRAGYQKFINGPFRGLAYPLGCQASVRENHTIDFHHALPAAAGLPLPQVPDAGHLHLPDGLILPPLPERYLLIHPGTAREEKFWPPAQWIALLDDLWSRYQLPLVMTGGDWAFERTQTDAILSGTKAPVTDLRGQLSLTQLAGVIAGARLAITVDTAALHLAAAFRVPQIALFGPTNPWHWAPRHPGAIVLQAGQPAGAQRQAKQTGQAMDLLPWNSVASAAGQLLEASSMSNLPHDAIAGAWHITP
jgi:ADP-heptose:LPS heptosyltransferase